MQNNRFSIAVLGAGNIGSAVLTRLQELDDKVLKLDLKKVLVSDISKAVSYTHLTLPTNREV